MCMGRMAGNQLPELLIFFYSPDGDCDERWESVTRTLDILSLVYPLVPVKLGISYQNS